LCGAYNALIEADAEQAAYARMHGWKIRAYEDPAKVPVFDRGAGQWYWLKNDWTRVEVTGTEHDNDGR
jgi:hypothetical protein